MLPCCLPLSTGNKYYMVYHQARKTSNNTMIVCSFKNKTSICVEIYLSNSTAYIFPATLPIPQIEFVLDGIALLRVVQLHLRMEIVP